jgi:hypothetical protein
MMQKLFNQCPSCGGQLTITECQCTECRLQIRGEFRLGQFSTLSEEELTFIRVFLAARGNLSEVERVLGISYPTIRNKLDEINNALDRAAEDTGLRQGKSIDTSNAGPKTVEESRKAILQKVADGELSPMEAVEKLQNMSGERQ